MGNKSTMRKFRRRRQRAGFTLFVSLAVVLVGVIALSGAGLSGFLPAASGDADEAAVQRVESPNVDVAPEAVAQAAAQATGSGEQASREGSSGEQASGGQAGSQEKSGDGQGSATEQRAQAEEGGDNSGTQVANAQEEPQQQAQQATGPPPVPKPATDDLWMDIPALGLNDNYIANSASPLDLDAGATKTPESAYPWQDNANTYISAHRLGYPGTASNYQFYNLPNLALGDRIYLYDENLTVYTYEVSGFLEVDPSETWVTAPQPGRDMISLMTCIENYGDYWTMGPNWNVRYVVQADRVSVEPA